MKYHIERPGAIGIIASFEHESDRDYCIETLREVYNDCVFTATSDEE
ncbi:hypothetical protein LCGC14_0360380 [marine sediment metagenome]|uniref:Uncharacterized protein n=1 Tax=marine sediment metagenome TaxID=412755 RepID=A0A0F9TE54_9ZZZZ